MKQWKKESISVDSVRSLHENFGVDYISATLLARRGVDDKKSLKYYLESDLSYLHNPFLFDEMEDFVMRVAQAKEEGEKVRVFGDRDVDGITSTALLVEFLGSMGIEVSHRLPKGDEPYGLTVPGIDEALQDDVTLIITVDCGISNIEEVEYAQSKGIDVLITDHHIAGDIVPDAIAIIDPKIEECSYPFTHLAGCGVVAKVIWAVSFAMSDFFQQEIFLFHAYPGNTEKGKETVIIEAVKMRNLLEIERMVEEVVPGILDVHQSRIISFLNSNLPIFALDVETERRLITRAFGTKIDIHIGELRQLLSATIPQIGSHSLFSLHRMSKSVKYSQRMSELDVLFSLFVTHVTRSIPYLRDKYEYIFDLVALGTIGDLMPMKDENRIMVKRGLALLNSHTRSSLIPLMTAQKLMGKQISTTDVSWQITPIINASGRMGTPEVALELLLSTKQDHAQTCSEQLLRLNKERQKMGEDSWNSLLPKAKNKYEEFEQKFLVVEDKNVNRGLTGIMASRLLRQFGVPSMVIAHIDENRLTGSMRSPTYFNIREFLSLFEDLFIDYGGHRCAGGFSIEKKNLPVLHERLSSAIEAMQRETDEEDTVTIDLELPPKYLTPEIISLVELFEPYGEGNPPIQFLISKTTIEEIRYLQNSRSNGVNHVKLTIRYGEYRWPAIFWNGSQIISESFQEGDEVDIVFRMGRNYFRNNETLQLTVIDIRKYKTPIEQIIR
ncbi:MAG: single-stranded-DNA-specific exonuclease RecJ [Sphaerochaetaceae bacterium]|nr:single-stranded-DNA-specific exonuclease RecJ [Sphaerochaetaceae bacterium]